MKNAFTKRQKTYLPRLETDTPGADDNPFLNRSTFARTDVAEHVRRAILNCTLVPVRLTLLAVLFAIAFLVAKLATVGLGTDHCHPLTDTPLPRWRVALFSPVNVLARLALVLLGFCVHVRGKCAPSSEAPIIVANHVSGLAEAVFFSRCAQMEEGDYMNAFLIPFMIGASGIFIDRSDPDSRRNAGDALSRRARDPRWPQTLVFPEGTCTNGRCLVQFKHSAFAPGCPVQPVVFRYRCRSRDGGGGRSDDDDHDDSGGYMGGKDPSFTFPHTTVSHLLGLCREPVNRMEVEFLPVYVPSDEEAKMPSLFAAGVQAVMAEALGIDITRHAAEDVTLCLAALRMKMPQEAGLVQWQALSENLTGIKVDHAKELMKQFRTIAKNDSACIDFPTFSAHVRSQMGRQASPAVAADGRGGRPGCWAGASPRRLRSSLTCSLVPAPLSDEDLRHIFDLLDINNSGQVNFQEYLCGAAILNGHGKDAHITALKWTFDCLAHGQEYFAEEQLEDVIRRVLPGIERGCCEQLFVEADSDGDGRVSRDEFINFAVTHRDEFDFLDVFRVLPLNMDP